jgi:hypothetical protein
VRERLLLSFNGWVNDNLLKVQHLRRQLSEEGVPPLVLLGSIAIADTFFPHIAFRPLEEIDLWVRPEDLERLSGAMREAGLAPEAAPRQRSIAARFANPDLDLRVWTQPQGLALTAAGTSALWERRIAAPLFGPAAFRLDPADAVCAHVAAMAVTGFAVPRVQLVDLREMLLRADGPEGESGFYAPKGKALQWKEVRERSRGLGLDRSLWAALRLVGELFPEVAPQAERSQPELPARVRAVLEELVVRPALNPHRTTVVRAVNAIRRRLLR